MARKKRRQAGASSGTGQVVKAALGLLIVAGFLSAVIYALVMKDDIKAAQIEAPLISAPDLPVKRRPDQPGGMQIPNRDKTVFTLLERPKDANAPKLKPKKTENILTEVKPEPVLDAAREKQELALVADMAETAAARAESEAQEQKKEIAQKAEKKLTELIQPKPIKALPKPAPTPKVTKAAGGYGVQLASFKTQADADRAALKFQQKFASELAALRADIQEADLGAKGVRYRVRFLGVDKIKAAAVCKKLSVKKQGCLRVKG